MTVITVETVRSGESEVAPKALEQHELRAAEYGRALRKHVTTGAKATARGATVTAHCVRGFFSGLLGK